MALQHDVGGGTDPAGATTATSVEAASTPGFSAIRVQQGFQRLCAMSGVVCPLLFFGGLLSCGFLPPLRPGASAIQIAAHYQQHATGIRVRKFPITLDALIEHPS